MIAMALACEPKLLIADEPTTALDVTIQAQILDLIDDLRQRLAMAVVLITHDMGVIAGRTDRVVVMYAGKVAEEAETGRAVRPDPPPVLPGPAGLGAQAGPEPRRAAAVDPGPAARTCPRPSPTAGSPPAASSPPTSAGRRSPPLTVRRLRTARTAPPVRLLPPGGPRRRELDRSGRGPRPPPPRRPGASARRRGVARPATPSSRSPTWSRSSR